MLHAALEGKLDGVEFVTDPVFNVQVPKSVPGVPNEVLIPQNTWKDKAEYAKTAKHLAGLFATNFKKYEAQASAEIKSAGPNV
jgi:phosphoenolpyruvate carboxykinase (ATP)